MSEKPQYLGRIDELEKVSIVRLKGNIDQAMIPAIENRKSLRFIQVKKTQLTN